jgi:hypothetical protein
VSPYPPPLESTNPHCFSLRKKVMEQDDLTKDFRTCACEASRCFRQKWSLLLAKLMYSRNASVLVHQRWIIHTEYASICLCNYKLISLRHQSIWQEAWAPHLVRTTQLARGVVIGRVQNHVWKQLFLFHFEPIGGQKWGIRLWVYTLPGVVGYTIDGQKSV